MKKKLQVFVSSTFTDLIDERQAAVEAILSAGHIPAGMELFKAGDESQKETIKKWIDESDVYVLILGGRYGTIEPTTGKSYTHWEYDYAGETGIPRFAMVINDEALEGKSKKLGGKDTYEIKNSHKYDEFKSYVLDKTSEFFDDLKDIKLIIHRKLAELAARDSLKGWISAKDIKSNESLVKHITHLHEENSKLKEKNEILVNARDKKEGNSSATANLGVREDISSRIEKIMKILRVEELDKYSEISWIENVDEEDEYEVKLPKPEKNFEAYFRHGEDEILELKLVGIVNLYPSFLDLLSEVRIMLEEHKISNVNHTLNVRFIIAVQGHLSNEIKEAEDFFAKALKASKIKNMKYYSLEIWDEAKLESIERELVLIN